MTLHSEQDAIKQAVEAGYEPPSRYFYGDPGHIEQILQDPAFWQALGKPRGWNLVDPQKVVKKVVDHRFMQVWYLYENTPMMHALRHLETILSGGDMTTFWRSLP